VRIDPRCKKIFATLSDYLDGELKDCRELEKHLRGCAPCLRYLRTLKLTTEACRQYGRLNTASLSPTAQSALFARLVKGLEARRHVKRDSPKLFTQGRSRRR
jgi:hypothetical protein